MFRFATCLSLLVIILAASACSSAHADKPLSHKGFQSWLADFRQEARSKGISESTLDDAFDDAEVIERVIELDRKQPESTLTLEEYLAKVISKQRITLGRAALAEHRTLLNKVSKEYQVAPEYIVALWGIETNYGSNTGGFITTHALATLAYEGRRADFFRDELMKVLQIAQSDGIPPSSIEGSWAGALGQCQFMPSSFLRFAVDYDGDGKRDIWHSQDDVFASIANYLRESGWNNAASLQDKHKVLMKWNRSTYFVTAVTNLAADIRK